MDLGLNWSIEEKRLELIYNWKISRNESQHKINSFITIKDNFAFGMGEVAPNVRYDENPEKIQHQFVTFLNSQPHKIESLEELTELLTGLNLCNSLRFGIESAYIHYLCAKKGIKVYNLLSLQQPKLIDTTYTLPIMEIGEIGDFIVKYNLQRFRSLKLKINSSEGYETIKEVSRHYNRPLKIDANEAWNNPEELLMLFEKIKTFNIEFVEQPMPANLKNEYIYLKNRSFFEILADESVTKSPDFNELAKQFHGVNMKLMKAGGYIEGIRILDCAKKAGLKTMIGCMVETTLGISSAMNLCNNINYIDLDGFFIIKNEPFNLVSEKEGLLFLK